MGLTNNLTMKNLIILMLAVVFISGCCSIKQRFSKDELKWLNVYNVDDTIVFQSSKGELDTIWIVKKDIFHPDCNPIISHGLYLPIFGEIYYTDETGKIDKLVGLWKYKYRTALLINLNKSSVFFIDIDKENMKAVKIGSSYMFDTFHPKAKENEPRYIFWHEDHGIIKFINHDGVEWKRINLDFEVE